MWILQFLLGRGKGIHETNGGSLEGVDDRDQNEEEKAPVAVVLADLIVVYLAHLDREYFHLSSCHLLHRFTDSAPVRLFVFFR